MKPVEKVTTIKTSRFDVTDYLDSEEMIAEYLSAIREEDEPILLVHALGDVAKARGLRQIDSATLPSLTRSGTNT
jgi:probable addiction module antidote protein